ncbi:MAG: hypothetical protein ABSG53_29200 [Thermoguttaceae bacterium]
MAVKKTATSSAAAATQSDGNADADFIQEAYGDALKNQVQVLITNYAANTPDPEKKFENGLTIIRKARDQALKSASAPTPKGKTDADFIQEAYGDALNNQVQVLVANYIANMPDPENAFADGLTIIRKARDQALTLALG